MRKVSLLIAILFFLAVISVDAAAERTMTSELSEEATMQNSYGAGWLIGHGVRNEQGEDLGSVVDILFAENGKIEYVILDQGGVLGRGILGRGIGDQLYAVPWSIADVSPAEDRITLDIAKGKLMDAPTFAKTEWEKFGDPDFTRSVYGYYDLEETPLAEVEQTFRIDVHRATSTLEIPVLNVQGERLGSLEELIVGEDDRIRYAIVSRGGFLGLGQALIPVPFHSIAFEPDGRTARLDMEKSEFENAPRLEGRRWSALESPDFEMKVHEYFE
ncbi:MAG: PRC-barrel domain-containing protein [Candidatus Abyssubacteria bacterium]